MFNIIMMGGAFLAFLLTEGRNPENLKITIPLGIITLALASFFRD